MTIAWEGRLRGRRPLGAAPVPSARRPVPASGLVSYHIFRAATLSVERRIRFPEFPSYAGKIKTLPTLRRVIPGRSRGFARNLTQARQPNLHQTRLS